MKNHNICSVEKNICTGCMACFNVCSANAISMHENEEGFIIPFVDDNKCVKCGLCYKKCPAVNKQHFSSKEKCIVGYNVNKNKSHNSTSGGIFPIIANYVLEKNGVVCGAIINKDNIEHIVSNDKNDIERMKGSKYSQSNIRLCYKEIKQELDKDRYCLFTGTPCQVAGLKSYLNKSYDKLICVDIVCHGVPNQKFLFKNIKENYPNYQLIAFREKDKCSGTSYKLILKNKNKIKKVYSSDDPYYNLFMNGSSMRESCYKCIYATKNRVSDITIGDSAYSNKYNYFKFGEITSLILINSNHGEKIWNEIKSNVDFIYGDFEKEITYNKQLNRPCNRNLKRDEIYKELFELNYKEFSRKYIKSISLINKIKRKIKSFIPMSFKAKLKKQGEVR